MKEFRENISYNWNFTINRRRKYSPWNFERKYYNKRHSLKTKAIEQQKCLIKKKFRFI